MKLSTAVLAISCISTASLVQAEFIPVAPDPDDPVICILPGFCIRRRNVDHRADDLTSRSAGELTVPRKMLMSMEHEEPRTVVVRLSDGDEVHSNDTKICAWASKHDLTCSSLLPHLELAEEPRIATRSEAIEALAGYDDVGHPVLPKCDVPKCDEIMLCTATPESRDIVCQLLDRAAVRTEGVKKDVESRDEEGKICETWYDSMCLNTPTAGGSATVTSTAISIVAQPTSSKTEKVTSVATVEHRGAIEVLIPSFFSCDEALLTTNPVPRLSF